MKEMKEEFVTTQHHKNTQDHKKLLQTIMHQQVQQIRRHELIPKNIQTIKTEPWRNKTSELTITNKEIKSVSKNLWWLHWWNLPNI